jgi:hypothetical protein
LMNSYDWIIAKAWDNAYIRVRLYRKNNKFTVFVHDNWVWIMGKEKWCWLLLWGMWKWEDLIREYSTSYYRRYSESWSHAKAELDLNFEQ